MKKIQSKINQIISKYPIIEKIYDKLNVVFEFILSLLLAYLLYKIAYIKETMGITSKVHLVIVIVISIIILGIIIINFKKYKGKIERKFISIVVPIGMMFLVLMVPYHVPDEAPHIIRAYEVYNGGFVATLNDENKHRAIIPEDLKSINISNLNDYKTLHEQLSKTTDYSKTSEAYTEAQSYPATLYLFSGMGMKIGQIFNMNIILCMYLGRIFNFIIFLVLSYYSLKLIPFGKLILAAYLLMPMMLQQACSVSPDSIINAICLFFISYIMYLTFVKEKIRKVEIGLLLGISIFIGIAKMVYFPIVLLLMLLFGNKKIPQKTKFVIVISCIIISLLSGLLWYKYQTRYSDERSYVQERNIDSAQQISGIISNIPGYVGTIENTIDKMGTVYLYGLVGDNLGWQNIQVNQLLIIVYLFLLVLAPFMENNDFAFNKIQRLFVFALTVGTVLLIFTGLYLIWSEVGSNIIIGVQGRYFIPCAILPLLIMCLKNNSVRIKNIHGLYFTIISIINIFTIFTIQQFFIK